MRLAKGSGLRTNRWLTLEAIANMGWLLASLLLAACASDSGTDDSASPTTTPAAEATLPNSGGDGGETSEPGPDDEPSASPEPEPDPAEEPEPATPPVGAGGTSMAPQENGGRGGDGGGGAGGATGGSAPNGSGGEVAVGGGSGGTAPLVGGAGAGGMSSGEVGIAIDGTTLRVNGEAFHIQGVAWNPVGPGQTHPAGLDYAGYADVDIPLMQAVGINAVRTYEPLLDRAVLDQLYEAGIYVLNSIYPYGGDDVNVVTARVSEVQDHPAILMWLLGNEWNYNGLYVDLPHDDALARLNEAAGLVRALDTEHPIATVYGELPDSSVIERMPEIDVWGINAYRGISFGGLFDDWQERSQKPMFLAEYGADAYNANIDSVDLESQAEAVLALVGEIANASSATGSGPCVGGAWFEWADEWWKDQGGSPDAQDIGGIAPGGGPHPDATFNEEWWGVVDLERNPRPAYDALGDMYLAR